MRWRVEVAKRAKKAIDKMPKKDRRLVLAELQAMADDPYAGDVQWIAGESVLRRRRGDWRIFYDVYQSRLFVYVVEIKRRSSKTYS